MPEIACPDCQVTMEIGFVPDLTHGAVMQTSWHAGTPEQMRFLGIPLHSIRTDPKESIPVWAFRCPRCGLLRLHAIPVGKGSLPSASAATETDDSAEA